MPSAIWHHDHCGGSGHRLTQPPPRVDGQTGVRDQEFFSVDGAHCGGHPQAIPQPPALQQCGVLVGQPLRPEHLRAQVLRFVVADELDPPPRIL
ncbi:hypothetical protein ADL17_17145 [Micromonospora maris]|uniref:Uncharacterized protein n=1 Tax=Micromonospora maris TaxID=1003110 RepID=A0A9X0I174_9ACTN|nr:hypothetical protein ADL17_17145 [Micromonospora maris]